MTSPKVSVIVPVYNAASTLARSVHSLLRQDLQSLEIILVDDASTDHSVTVMQALAEDDARIKTIFKTNNGGVHEARRSGLEVTAGRWIGFMDADDYVEPKMFSNLLAAGEANDSDIVICSVDRVSPSGERLGIKFRFREEQNLSDQVFERFCRHEFGTGSLWNKLYRRELIMEHGSRQFHWRQDINEDTLVNIGCFYHAQSITTLPTVLYHYVSQPDSSTLSNTVAQSFVDMLSAYTLALITYNDYGEQCHTGIDTIYKNQLSYPCYYVDNPYDLIKHEDKLKKSLVILANNRPLGLAALLNCIAAPPIASNFHSFREQAQDWRQSTAKLMALMWAAALRRIAWLTK